jgi:hypothetical protein
MTTPKPSYAGWPFFAIAIGCFALVLFAFYH